MLSREWSYLVVVPTTSAYVLTKPPTPEAAGLRLTLKQPALPKVSESSKSPGLRLRGNPGWAVFTVPTLTVPLYRYVRV